MTGFDRFANDLPWGWWLRADATGVEDEQGRRWKSVRDAFWRGRLGFPDVHVAPEQHEFLLRMLSGIHAQWHGVKEQRFELFEGNMALWRFYQCWLASIGMLATTDPWAATLWDSALNAGLSAEGRSVMTMLQATRQPEWEDLPLAAVVDAVVAARRSPEHDTRIGDVEDMGPSARCAKWGDLPQ